MKPKQDVYTEPQRNARAGFTLIELLIVVVIIGILAAIIVPRFDQFRQRAHFVSIVNDFRNLGAAQERYFQINREYATDIADIDFATSTGVELEVTEATVDGWAAIGTHVSLDADQGCGIYMGDAAAPALPSGAAMTVDPGLPECAGSLGREPGSRPVDPGSGVHSRIVPTWTTGQGRTSVRRELLVSTAILFHGGRSESPSPPSRSRFRSSTPRSGLWCSSAES